MIAELPSQPQSAAMMPAVDKFGGADAEWRMCADWLLRCLASCPDILAQAQSVLVDTPGATVVDLLNCLTDGVLLCHILPAISSQQVTPEQLPGFKLATLNSQFAFRRNLNLFLSACQTEFGLSPADLFSPDDLLSQENVGRIIRTLSLLSNSPRAKQSGIEGFTVATSSNGNDAAAVTDLSSDYCNLMATATAKKSQQRQHLAVPTAADQPVGSNYVDAAAERVYETIMNKTLVSGNAEDAGAKRSAKEICMEELVTTERTYVETLRLLVEDIMRPMKESQSSWTPVEVDAIFEHLPELLSLHKKLLRELEVATQLRGAKPLPAVLISYHNQLLLYGNYCAHMTEAISLLEDACRSDKRRQEELQRHLTAAKAQFKLNEYLAVPMQRVLRYHLLVRSLMDYDRKEGGKDKELLKEAHDAMCDVATYVNETKRDTEMRVLINQIQTQISSLDMPGSLRLIDYGRLEQDGDLRIANDVSKPNGSSKLRVCFLWTRMFMMAKPRPGLTFKTAFAVKPNLFIREVDLASPNQLANSSASGPAGNRSTTSSRRTLDPPAMCTVCNKLIHGCFFQGYKCRKSGHVVHKQCIPTSVIAPPSANNHGRF
uniref:Protein vav n=1 Tax=Macrostomum lignano TaxID=282301 RepID=A0A1I8J8C1_9PLAT